MKPIKPKYTNLVNLDVKVTDKTKETLSQYSKFNKYTEGEIIDILINEILEDDNVFREWLSKQRYSKRINKKVLVKSNKNAPIKEKDVIDIEETTGNKETC